MKIASIAIALSLTMYGCVAPMTEKGASIRIVDNRTDFNCQFLDTVEGKHKSGLNSAEDIQSTTNLARNKAAEIGANAILIINGESIESYGAVFAEVLQCDFNN